METKRKQINNTFYDGLHEKWNGVSNHPIALLCAENGVRTPWIAEKIDKFYPEPCKVLDIGCGGGLLTNPLARKGHEVTGIDLSQPSLDFAKQSDDTNSVVYLYADAHKIPLESGSFDVICAMDLLEHVDNPCLVIEQAARLLKPSGVFFFHTFNRNLLSYLLVIKGVEWFVKNTPKNMHLYSHFIKPEELEGFCKGSNLEVLSIEGFVPDMKKWSFWKTALTREIAPDFSFCFSTSLLTGYIGYARKNG
ncbi:MAG: bifunctional 2-polyprenyl-6-hydroxyphenol methylase/3-demethylubiquinol 3-O-methyltransferase UbiG [Chlamydiae bacterium]|nr:bifunctional 2-polyprenyl-6-hydroxyphenol methylase/3-demethylubiquinol 3-O-methyltransferase UbiG [Chlamydiota bacterium]